MDIDGLISELTPEEKCSLLAGEDFWHTKSIPRLQIPALRMSDGPNGVRGTQHFDNTPAACFPCGTAFGATWDTWLMQAAGTLMGQESIAKGASVLLGPTVNIQRSPLGGRGFESFSEDPYLSGSIAAATIRGIQNTGVVATIKHLLCNDQEHERTAEDSIVTERALREIYLMPFQIAERDSKPGAYMTSYNKVNGKHCSESKWLIDGILRKEWGFDGVVLSDWWGTYSTAQSINAGLDIEMPGATLWRGRLLLASLGARKVTIQTIDARVRKILELIKRVAPLGIPERKKEGKIDTPETAATLRKIGTEGIVLCKNDGQILPFSKNKTTAVIGPNAKFTAFSGGGSAKLTPYHAITPFEGLSAQCDKVQYSLGCIGHKSIPLLSAIARRPNSQSSGVEVRVYLEPPEVTDRRPIDTIFPYDTDCFLDGWVHPKTEGKTFWFEVEGIITPEEDGDYLFSLIVNGTAKLFVDGKEIVDNTENQCQGDSFFGMGTVEEIGTMPVKRGQNYTVLVKYGSSSTSKLSANNPWQGKGGIRIGCTRKTTPEELVEEAVALAKSVDQVILCIGLNYEWESEGYDRTDMALPPGTDDLVAAVCSVNKNVVVINQSGTPVAMPWVDKTPAILQAWYGGNETGHAIADVVFGKANPSGKMPLSWPKRLEDNPAFLNYRSENGKVLYGENVYVGYRFYEKTKRDILFPFGHGLSYSTFAISDLDIIEDAKDTITASISVINSGSVAGAEVVQLYVTQHSPSIQRPPQELKAFKKIFLEPGQCRKVDIRFSKKYASSFWDESVGSFVMERGTYEVRAGTSSAGEKLSATFNVKKTVWWKGL